MNIVNNAIYSHLNELFSKNNAELSALIDRLKAINTGHVPASHDVAGIKSAASFRYTSDAYQPIYNKLLDAKGATSIAVKAGQTAYTSLSEMMRLATLYPDLTQDPDRQNTDAEFKSHAGIVENLKTSVNHDGVLMFKSGTVLRIKTNPNGNTLDITFDSNDIPNVKDFNLWGASPETTATVQTELTKLHSYLGKAYSYDSQVTGYLAITDSVINSARNGFNAATDTSAKDLAAITSIQVRQQNLASIFSQGNINPANIARLFDNFKLQT